MFTLRKPKAILKSFCSVQMLQQESFENKNLRAMNIFEMNVYEI